MADETKSFAEAGSVLVFDVLGSLLDEDAGQRASVKAVFDLEAAAEERFLAGWSDRFHDLVTRVRDGSDGYRTSEGLHRQAVLDTAAEQGLPLRTEQADVLARFGRALDPFPDVRDAMDALARQHPLVALTNAGFAQAFAMSRHAELRWTTLLSGEAIGAYKPDPRMYRYVVGALDLDPRACVFVAAHQWDLDAAAEHGFATAYLDRAGDGGHAGYDFVAPDLAALSRQQL